MQLRLYGMSALAAVALGIPAPAGAQSPACAEVTERLSAVVAENRCERNVDCAALQLPPPFGCNVAINKRFIAEGEGLRDAYQHECRLMFQCSQPIRKLTCEKRRCTVLRSAKLPGDPSNSSLTRHGRPLGRPSCR